MIKFNYYDNKSSYTLTTFTIGEDKFELKNNEKNSFKMNIFKNDKLVTEIDFKATQEYLFTKFGKGNHYDLTQKQLSFTGLAENIGYKISLENIAITTSDNKLKLNSTNGILFLRLNRE